MTSTTVGELVERLLSREHRGRFTLGGGTLSADGKGASWGGKKIMGLRNPDGPVAAELISSLQKEIDTYRDALERLSSSFTGGWAGMYRDRVEVIGEVEQIARAALSNTGGHNG